MSHELRDIDERLARIERALLSLVRIEERVLRLEEREEGRFYPSTMGIYVASTP